MKKQNCYECVHRLNVAGSAHSRCNNHKAKVEGHEQGKRNGWFNWPLNFDPTWLLKCDGFSGNPKDKKERIELDPFSELLAILK